MLSYKYLRHLECIKHSLPRTQIIDNRYKSNRSYLTTCQLKKEVKSTNKSRKVQSDNDNLDKLRNIGIVAHINAGKTTTTERILFHAGSTEIVGDVDRGNTVTDYLDQERDRGITITSAAVTYFWRQHRINLIDTPGHVDFTIEVERSLSVLDGAVTVLDASAGVEAQTISVWNQAKKYNLPNIIFLNKYDKPQADLKGCMTDLKKDLDMNASLIQLPVKLNDQKRGNFKSIIDLIKRQLIIWNEAEEDKGKKFSILNLNNESKIIDKKFIDQMEMERERLINTLCDYDEILSNHVIACDKVIDVSGDVLVDALRRATIECNLCPVLVGSSFKYIGVQQLMDAILDYLPSPAERRHQICDLHSKLNPNLGNQKDVCAFIFKIMHDKRLGALNYMRIYNGLITSQMRLDNLESGKSEQVKKIYRAFADELKEIEAPVGKDDIVVATGLSDTRTGDVLVGSNFVRSQESLKIDDSKMDNDEDGFEDVKAKSAFQLLGGHVIVPKIEHMEPVYFCSIESRSISQQLKLEHALACMSREDPSLTYDIDSMGLTTIRGMGKLHLEVVRDRIKSEYGVDAIMGPLQISYRETIGGSANAEVKVDRLINSVKSVLSMSIYIRSKPGDGIWTHKKLRIDTSSESNLTKLRQDHRKAIENGFKSALMHGPLLGYPVIDCDILLVDFKANGRCGLPVISSAASQCLMDAMRRCSPILLEPIMLLEVVCPVEHNSTILSDITTSRRGIVLSTQARTNGLIVIRSQTPLSTLSNYAEFLRVATSGRAGFSMELQSYSAMSELDRQSVTRL